MKELFGGRAIIAGLETINFNHFPNVQCIGYNTTGEDHIDFAECSKRGIKVFTLKGERAFLDTITSTAEHTIGLMLALIRKTPWAFEDVKKGNWNREQFTGHTLKGKQLGIIGNGRIGTMVGHYATALGMNVVGLDKGADQLVWENIFSTSDIISIHLPLNEETEEIIDGTLFDIMKPSAYFLNTSRGKIISEECLLRNLQEQRLAGAALDVVDGEPKINEKLVAYAQVNDNLLITPHCGGNTFEDREATEKFIIKRVEDYINKK